MARKHRWSAKRYEKWLLKRTAANKDKRRLVKCPVKACKWQGLRLDRHCQYKHPTLRPTTYKLALAVGKEPKDASPTKPQAAKPAAKKRMTLLFSDEEESEEGKALGTKSPPKIRRLPSSSDSSESGAEESCQECIASDADSGVSSQESEGSDRNFAISDRFQGQHNTLVAYPRGYEG
ncbi:predicted protein [Nematostella vectensis]|uniref:Uncharacterized protein n=1 Tax=Nematostella vectensis TaxID=45351 RepID=A7RV56_NEMVE|nr:predicted protein [Nematostella vectensis]|eukprot:XP_001636755.1 predicted protein [Nematostella vectensis]